MHFDSLNYEKANHGNFKGDMKVKSAGLEEDVRIKRENYSTGTSKFLEFYINEDYENYIVQYNGDILKSLEPINYARAYASGQNYFAAIAVRKGKLQDLLKAVPQIINVEKSYPFTLCDLEITNEPYDSKLFSEKPEGLNGEGIIIGIIGTGIDYLNSRFMTQDNRSRVVAIWDQTIEQGPTPETIRYGTNFSKEKIYEAIRAYGEGKDPYAIVNHKDEVGHGTSLAGIIGARNLGEEDDLVSIAPKCEFAIVKLKEAKQSTLEMNGINERTGHIYESTDISAALEYLGILQGQENKPMVVYVPLESNCGGHDGQTSLERYIELYNMRRGFVVTCSTGSEANKGTHTSGILTESGDIETIEMEVGQGEKKFCLSIWATRPDKFSLGIAAPTGEKVEKIEIPKAEEGEIQKKVGDSTITIQHFIQDQSGGEQVIILIAENIKAGIWQVNLIGDTIVNGRYDIWMHQKELLREGTKF